MSDDLRAALAAEGLEPGSWSNGPGDRYASHSHAYDKVLVVERGSIAFGVSSDGGRSTIELAEGDRLDLPVGTSHDALVGPGGVTCLEAHLPAGTLDAVPRMRPAQAWLPARTAAATPLQRQTR